MLKTRYKVPRKYRNISSQIKYCTASTKEIDQLIMTLSEKANIKWYGPLHYTNTTTYPDGRVVKTKKKWNIIYTKQDLSEELKNNINNTIENYKKVEKDKLAEVAKEIRKAKILWNRIARRDALSEALNLAKKEGGQ